MNKIVSVLAILAVFIGFASCNKDDDSTDYTEYYEWRDQNNAVYQNLCSYLTTYGKNAYFADTVGSQAEPLAPKCFYRVLNSANEDSLRAINRWITPYYTSTLKMHYTLYDPESVMEKLPTDAAKCNDVEYMNSIFLDGVNKADTLESMQVKFFENFTPGDVIVGWGDLLQQMHIGDNWLVFIPWYLAYGQAGNTTIDPYSNLYFRMQLVDITSWGGNIPEVK